MQETYNKTHNFRAWLPENKIEPSALEQIHNLAQLPDVHQWIAVMPDVHPGFGMPIGGVLALRENIIPNAVGVDIGCGVLAISTNLKQHQVRPKVETLLREFLREIPVGFKKRSTPLPSKLWQKLPSSPVVRREEKNARLQIGSLGGGNHFIEIQQDQDGAVWLMLHSGSRNLGKQIADHYDKLARRELSSRNISFPPGLAWLKFDSHSGKEYFQAMQFAVDFAAENRRQMAALCIQVLQNHFPGLQWEQQAETIHNYAAREEHYGATVTVHRKGAVLARGKVAIPGTMGTASYIAQGLEHPASFCSCAHGAGRVLGRKEARRKLNSREVMDHLEKQQIVLITPDRSSAIEEASAAYKDIEEVMGYQQQLVKPLLRLTPMGVVKG